MPFPQEPAKHRWEPLFTATDFQRYVASRRRGPPPKPPARVVMVFGSRWKGYLARKYRGALDSRTGIFRTSANVGVVNVDGPGAPFAAIVVEELAALGVRRFVVLGLAGSLTPALGAGSVVLCTKALRDEGTSHHYQKASTYAHPDRQLTEQLAVGLQRSGTPFARGASWTIDAPYRETVPELRRYRRAGILTVEMEASAAFAVSQRLHAAAAALFVISDHLTDAGWEPRFHDTRKPLRRVLQVALSALET